MPAQHEYEKQKFANRQLFIQKHSMSGILSQANALKKLKHKRKEINCQNAIKVGADSSVSGKFKLRFFKTCFGSNRN